MESNKQGTFQRKALMINIKDFVNLAQEIQADKYDIPIAITGDERVGKTTLSIDFLIFSNSSFLITPPS